MCLAPSNWRITVYSGLCWCEGVRVTMNSNGGQTIVVGAYKDDLLTTDAGASISVTSAYPLRTTYGFMCLIQSRMV
jgi:hypothetical protein